MVHITVTVLTVRAVDTVQSIHDWIWPQMRSHKKKNKHISAENKSCLRFSFWFPFCQAENVNGLTLLSDLLKQRVASKNIGSFAWWFTKTASDQFNVAFSTVYIGYEPNGLMATPIRPAMNNINMKVAAMQGQKSWISQRINCRNRTIVALTN